MVLGVQWLESLGLILWDFSRGTLVLVRDGCHVVWSASTTPPALTTSAMLAVTNDELMEALLQDFAPLFCEPTVLPPPRNRSHQIHLLPGTTLVVVWPYHYTYDQKAELERQCDAILQNGVIRPSSLAFFAPVLVKKSDGSWRFCADYRALNDRIVKDKFPIPVVEELLNELRGARFFSKLDLCSGYHQVRMDPTDIAKTAFRTHQGLFEFLVMSFGL
jgi:hypothetical protein